MDFEPPTHQEARAWADLEFAALDCGDVRRKRRFLRVASDFIRNPSASVPDACGDWAGTKACYRLFDRPETGSREILAAHRAAMLARLAAAADAAPLLLVQDTTSLNYGTHGSKHGLGPTSANGKDKTPGLFIHGLLVAGASGEVHGLAGASIYARKERGGDEPAGLRNRQPLEEKESLRWVEGWHEAQRLWEDLGGTRDVICVADREADIYELLAACQQTRAAKGGGAGLLVRSQHDRRLADGGGTLWQAPAGLPVRAAVEVELPRGKQGLKARTATLAVRAGRVRLEVPAHKKKYLGLEGSLDLWALEVLERDPPPGIEPVCWRLLTTEAVGGESDARRLAGWYALRWQIEVMHRVLKTGCRVESRQVRAADKLKAFIALDLVVAVHLLALVMQARITPQAPAGTWLSRDEWEALAVHAARGGPPPLRPPSTAEAVRMIAMLGGFLGRKGDGDPGPEVLWRGLAKLRTLAEAWQIFKQARCG
ncbi:MAG: IS4 family transposase [Pseudomonadota bacterium]